MRLTMLTGNNNHQAPVPTPRRWVMLMAALLAVPAMAQQRGQKVFPSPEEASAALVSAAERNDQDAMIGILGRDAKQIVSSGDDAEDASNRANFVQRYQEMHRLVA